MTTIASTQQPAAAARGGIEYVQGAALVALVLLHLGGPWLTPALSTFVPETEPGRGLVQDGIWALAAALVPTQTILALAWLMLGPGAWYIRVPAVALFLPFIWWPQVGGYDNSGGQQFMVMFGAVAAIGVGLLRLNGWTVQVLPDDSAAALRFRFSLLSILGLTGGVAGLIVVGRLALAPFGPPWLIAWLAVSMAALASVLLWAILAPGSLWWRLLIGIGIAAGMSFLGPALDEPLRMNFPFFQTIQDGTSSTIKIVDTSAFRGPWWTVATWMTAYVTLFGGTLLTLRECDFRLVTDVDAPAVDAKEAMAAGSMDAP